MTITLFRDYQELLQNCVWYSDGSVNSSGLLSNLVNPSLNGTLYNSPTTSGTNRFGQTKPVMDFGSSNTSKYVDTGIVINYANFTLLFWMYPYTNTGHFGGHYSTTHYGIQPEYDATGITLSIVANNTWNQSFLPFNVANWNFCGISGDASNNIIRRVNGNTSISTFAHGQTNNPSTTFYFGKVNYPSAYWDPSIIGESWIYNRALSSAEIKAIYDITKLKYINSIIPGVRGVE